ncbi:MAG: hypothetical protein Q4C64_02395 [Erysipelotrichia bacterium]|nr:hypothetical protein [Erysipelotrichia bacterium]
MLISTDELKALYSDFKDVNDDLLKRKLKTIESTIRAYTHNNFQNRQVRCICSANSNILTYLKGNWIFREKDTIQLNDGGLNNGLYVISKLTADNIEIGETLYSSDEVLVTKIQYPDEIIEGAINLLKWDVFERDNHEGIASESISRHSVSYVNYDASNTINGYPSKLFGFCATHMRFKV